jgi:hypothetical protein
MQGRSGKVQINANHAPIIHTANRGQSFASRVQEGFYPSQTTDIPVTISMSSETMNYNARPQNFGENLAQVQDSIQSGNSIISGGYMTTRNPERSHRLGSIDNPMLSTRRSYN